MATKKMATRPKGDEEIFLRLEIGLLCDPISKQLRKQKLKFDPETVKHLQKDAEAWCRLKFRYKLPDKLGDYIMELIWKRVAKHVAEQN